MGITFPLPVWPTALALNPASKASRGLYGGRCNILRKNFFAGHMASWQFEKSPGNSNDWVAAKGLKLSYYIGETLLFPIYTQYGNLTPFVHMYSLYYLQFPFNFPCSFHLISPLLGVVSLHNPS